VTIVRLLFLVLGLSQVRGCFTPLCEAVGGFETKVFTTRTGDQMLADAAKTADGELIVETALSYLPPEYHHTVVKMDDAYGPQELASFSLSNYFGSGVVASGDSWWYSLAGTREENADGVFFLTPEQTFVPVDEIYSADWIPFDGPEPRGLLVGAHGEETRAMEVAPGGVRRRWSMPPVSSFAGGWRDAERLPDGAIALVTFQPASGLELRLLDGDEPAAVSLRKDAVVRLVTALSADGMVAVVTESRLGELEAAVFDPKNPGTLRWLALTTKDEPGRYPQVVFHDGRFIAAWFARGANELRARTFTGERAGAAATIAPFLRRGNAPVSISILPEGEELLFVWQEDEPTMRRVPADFAGLWFAERLCKWLFSGTSVAL
jgi:hypothetical protein